ncbi:MAG: hypothetical protein IIC87_07740, partial [Chloroflexi bacterium]|nr:hypothetical protein [Chloroflexota bacterium]
GHHIRLLAPASCDQHHRPAVQQAKRFRDLQGASHDRADYDMPPCDNRGMTARILVGACSWADKTLVDSG